jgi:hypothetical protein
MSGGIPPLSVRPHDMLMNNFTSNFVQGCTDFPKMYAPSQNSSFQNGDMTEVQYPGATNVRRCHTNFGHHVDLAPGICAPLLYFAISTLYETILLKN